MAHKYMEDAWHHWLSEKCKGNMKEILQLSPLKWLNREDCKPRCWWRWGVNGTPNWQWQKRKWYLKRGEAVIRYRYALTYLWPSNLTPQVSPQEKENKCQHKHHSNSQMLGGTQVLDKYCDIQPMTGRHCYWRKEQYSNSQHGVKSQT